MSGLCRGRALGSRAWDGSRGTSLAQELLGLLWAKPTPRCLQQLLGKEPGGSCSSYCRRHPQPCGITPSPLALGEAFGARWDLCGGTESPPSTQEILTFGPALCPLSQPFLRDLGQLQQGNPHWILEVWPSKDSQGRPHGGQDNPPSSQCLPSHPGQA